MTARAARAPRPPEWGCSDAPALHPALLYAVLVIAVSSFALLQSMVMPVLGPIREALDADVSTGTWVLTANLLSAAVFTPLAGRAGDAVGRRPVLVVALLALACGSFMAAVSPNAGWMILARVIQGAGGGVLPLSFSIIRDEYPPERAPAAIGVLAGVVSLGAALGLVVAGPVVELLGIRWLFWLPMAVSAVAAVAAYAWAPHSGGRDVWRVSWAPVALLPVFLISLLLALVKGPDWGWGSPVTVALLLVALVSGPAWVACEMHARSPLVDMHLMRLPTVRTCNLLMLLLGAAAFATFTSVPQVLQAPRENGYGLGLSLAASGLMLLPIPALAFVAGLVATALARWVGARAVVVAGCAQLAASLFMLTVDHYEPRLLLVALALHGFGFGLVSAVVPVLVVQAVPSHQTGIASGVNANIRTIGGAIGTALMATIVAEIGFTEGHNGYTRGFLVLAVLGVVATAIAATLPRSGTDDVAIRQTVHLDNDEGPVDER